VGSPVLDGAVIEIEAIDVHEGFHTRSPKKAEAGPMGSASRLAPEGTRGVWIQSIERWENGQWQKIAERSGGEK
jgi:hypothetical protein